MKDEKILAEEVLSDEELDIVAGGTRLETYGDGAELVKRGLLSAADAEHCTAVREAIHRLGYKYEDNGGSVIGSALLNSLFGIKKDDSNKYYNKQGVQITREQFWQNFDAENGTKIIQ